MKKKGEALKTYWVYVAQVNQTRVVVRAKSEDEARQKGYRQWRRDGGHSYVCAVEEQEAKP